MAHDLPHSSSRRARAYRSGAALFLLAGLVGCTSAGVATPPILDSERRRFDAALRMQEDGLEREAAFLYREVVRSAPHFVAAHRALQNLELADHRRGELLLRYRELRDADPRSAAGWYLWGRVLSDPAEQREAFETARRLDKRSPWPLLGLGAMALAAGDVREAIESLGHARELAPDLRDVEIAYVRALLADERGFAEAERLLAGVLDAEPWDVARVLLLGELRARQERPREAIEALGRMLSRKPRNADVAARLLDRLESDGTVEDATWVERELEAEASEPLVLPILARCHAMRGDAGAAIAAWSALPDLSSEERAWRRMLRVLRGELPEAMAEESPRFVALARVGASTPAWDEARSVLPQAAAATPDDRSDVVALAAAFSRMGWIEEAIALLRPSGRGAPADESSTRLLERLLGQRQLEAELKALALETYRRFATGHGAPDFGHFTQRMGAAARHALGDDLLDGARPLSFWPVGEMLDPTSESGLPAYFRQCGRLLVAGQRRGRPPEIVLASVLGTGVAGPQRAQLSFIEGTLIPSWLEHQGARFAGAALDRFVYVDVSAVEEDVARLLASERRIADARDRVLADPVQPASDRGERTSVSEPAEVATKLELRALDDWRTREPRGDRESLLAEALDAVLQHETGHLEDAARWLPLSSHAFGAIFQFARLGFSSARVEEWLEMRAECIALARARNPYLVLAGCAGQFGGSGGLTPHGGGYEELLRRLVGVIEDSPEFFPQLDRKRNLLQQLDRLTPRQIRVAAEGVLAELGLD
jgi:tetratricopeptide (TPR) repeat protein